MVGSSGMGEASLGVFFFRSFAWKGEMLDFKCLLSRASPELCDLGFGSGFGTGGMGSMT